MAILKVSSQEESGADAFSASLRYVSNPAKTNENDHETSAQSFEDLSLLNRYAYGQENRDRYYKHAIIALELEWPSDTLVRKSFVDKLYQVISACRAYYNDKSFRSIGCVHQDTAHPHIHLIIDTCNVETGRQLSQSPKDLEDFKLYVSEQLMQYGLNETIRTKVSVVSEEEMLADDESTVIIEDGNLYDDYDDEYYDHSSPCESFDDEPDQYDDNGSEDEYSGESRWAIIVSLRDKLPQGLLGRLHFNRVIDEVMRDGIMLLSENGLYANGYNCTPEQNCFILLVIPECSNVTWDSEEVFAEIIERSCLFQTLSKALMRNGLIGPESISYEEVSIQEYKTNECFGDDRLDSITLSSGDGSDMYDYRYDDPDISCDEDYVMSDEELYEFFNRLNEAAYEEWNNGTLEPTFLDRLVAGFNADSHEDPAAETITGKLLCKDIEKKELKLLCIDIDDSQKHN